MPLGVAEVKRPGRDVTVVATGLMVHKALAAASAVAADGVEVEVIDPRTLVPLDRATILDSVRRTGQARRGERGRSHLWSRFRDLRHRC